MGGCGEISRGEGKEFINTVGKPQSIGHMLDLRR